MAEQDFPMMINYKTLVKNYIMAMLILPTRDFQFFCAAVIAFNRYTALYWHFAKVEAFWNRATLPFIISGLTISIAMALTQAVPENFYLRWGIKLGIWTLIYLLILTGISFIFNLLVLIKLVLIKNRGGAESGKLLSQAEKKLCFVSLYSFTFVLTFIFAQIMNLVLDEADSFKDFTHESLIACASVCKGFCEKS
ncbi:unnamed protein product, partial [Mesorhabditis spiculigera]